MIELPRMLHHVGAQRRIVTSQAEYDQAIAEGWQHRPVFGPEVTTVLTTTEGGGSIEMSTGKWTPAVSSPKKKARA